MNESQVFTDALNLADPAERAAYLDRACAADARLRAAVEALLRAHAADPEFLEQPAASLGETAEEPGRADQPGAVLDGRYKLLEQIGEGGFGVVYMAEQTRPVRRKVALKVLKPGMDTRHVVARFEAERQALALMDHPHIARVFDCGAADSGRPFFVMELVRGLPITEFCDQNHQPLRQRLELFLAVCQAVQHAHTKGIIHRDLKPSNILVTLHDGTPVVKVIDFGIAKALGQQLTDKTVFTGFAQMIGTPLYMSPEQAEMSGLDVDTRSDVYSLGVLLYELLTGTTPFDQERLRTAGYDEMRRIIREEEPARPSARISTLGMAAGTTSSNRASDLRRLRRLVRGELDWIVMKALEKDRTRRYETTSAFAADVQRYLHDEPVQACPPSVGYRLRKFVRRNKGPVLAGSLVALTLVGGFVGTTWGLIDARRGRDAAELAREDAVKAGQKALDAAAAEQKAKETAETSEAETRAVLEFVEQKILAAMRPEQNGGLGRQATLRRAIEEALPFVENSFQNQPLTEARLRITIGQSFQLLGEREALKRAADQFQTAAAIYFAHLGPDHPSTLVSLENLANAYGGFGLHVEAAELREDLLVRQKVALGLERPNAFRYLEALAHEHDGHGRRAEALPLHEEMLTMQSAKLGRDHPDTLARMRDVASRYADAGRHPDALKLRTELLALHKDKDGPDHADTLSSMAALAGSHARLGRYAEGLLLLEECLALVEAKRGSHHPDTGSSRATLYRGYVEAVRRVGALKVREDLSVLSKAREDPDHPSASLLWRLRCLADVCSKSGRHAEAVKLREELLALRKTKFGPDAPDTLFTMDELVYSYRSDHRPAEAVKVVEEKLAIQIARLGPDHLDTLASKHLLATCLFTAGRSADALKLAEETLALRRNKLGSDHPDTLDSVWSVALFLIRLKRGAEAVPLIDECVQHAGRKDIDPTMIPRLMGLRLQHFEAARDADGCRATAELWEKLNRTDADSLYSAARMRAVTAAVIRGADSKSAPRAEDAEADRAMAWLKQAVAAGFNNAALLKGDGAFAVLRDRDDFTKLVADVAVRKESGAARGPAVTPANK